MMEMITVKATIVGKVKETKPKRKRIWDNYLVVGEVQKSDRIKFVIAAAARDGVRYINIREFYFRQKDGIWRPGRDGITIPLIVPIEQGTKLLQVYVPIVETLSKAASTAHIMELYNEQNAIYTEVKKDEDQGA